jgi:hypothetical protein
VSVAPVIDRRRLKTPPDAFGLLIEPAPAALRRLAEGDHAERLRDVMLCDESVAQVRESLRAQLNLTGPVVLTGHQVEFFHPGVLAKTIAVDALARQIGGSGVFLATDADLPKQLALTVPRVTQAGIDLEHLPLPGIDPNLPIESQPISQRRDWLQLFTRVGNLLSDYDARMMKVFASAWIFGANDRISFERSMHIARLACERELGLNTVAQLTLSSLSQTRAYRLFVAHLIQHAEQFATIHNHALRDYQRRFRVRNPERPVAPLAVQGAYVELPFWVSEPAGPRRRLGVIRHENRYTLLADQTTLAELSPGNLADELADFSAWRIRPRALTLTMFTRLLLSDLFIHGIGGAKYDDVTDACAREFFGTALPPIGCVSATMRLDLPRFEVTDNDLLAAQRNVRDVRYNPQRHAEDLPGELLERRAELIERSDDLRANHPEDHAQRRAVFNAIRQVNADLNASVPELTAAHREKVTTLHQQLDHNRRADNREYFQGLFHKRDLERLCRDIRSAFSAAT